MSLDGFRQKHKYANGRSNFTDFSIRQAYVGAEATLQEGRAIRYDNLADPQTLAGFKGKIGESLLDNAKKAFPQGVIDWNALTGATIPPEAAAESIDDITFGLYGIGVRTATSIVSQLGKNSTFNNYTRTAGAAASRGLERHLHEALIELSDPATIADFENQIIDATALTAVKQNNGYSPQIMGALIEAYDSINEGKAPADVRKLSAAEVTRLLSKQ